MIKLLFVFFANFTTKILPKKKIKPKRGRVVLFDGKLYHTAEQPNNHKRCIVNYDLVDLSVDSHI